MRLLIDGNILLDVLQNRLPHAADSAKIWKICETSLVDGFISALTFADLVYIMRKELDTEIIESIHKKLTLIFSIVDLKESDVNDAVALRWNDFEDAVQSATASRIGADYIITRNIKDFKNSSVTALTPAEFLMRI